MPFPNEHVKIHFQGQNFDSQKALGFTSNENEAKGKSKGVSGWPTKKQNNSEGC